MIKLSCTHHAKVRARHRIRWHRRTLDRMLERVFYNGLGPDDCPKRLTEFIAATTEANHGLTRICGEHLFRFTRDDPDEAMLLTVYVIPSELKPSGLSSPTAAQSPRGVRCMGQAKAVRLSQVVTQANDCKPV